MNFTQSSCAAAATRLVLALTALVAAVPFAAQSSPDTPANDAVTEKPFLDEKLLRLLRLPVEQRKEPEHDTSRGAALAVLRDVDLSEADVTPPRSRVGSIRVVSASVPISDRYGTKPFRKGATLCLAANDEAVLASVRVTFTVRGERCFTVADAERVAFEQEQREAFKQKEGAAEKEALYRAEETYYAAYKSGDPAQIERAKENLIAAARRSPTEVERWRDDGLTTVHIRAAPFSQKHPRAIIFRVANGSSDALARFPRGTIVQRSMSLCLRKGEQMTVAASNGQTATYTGPGCLKRLGRPTRENLGAFVFGLLPPNPGLIVTQRIGSGFVFFVRGLTATSVFAVAMAPCSHQRWLSAFDQSAGEPQWPK